MINPNSINPASLPSLPLTERRSLPAIPCIYFLIDLNGNIQHVGSSLNLQGRFKNHQQCDDVSVAWIDYSHLRCVELLPIMEAAWIKEFKQRGLLKPSPTKPRKTRTQAKEVAAKTFSKTELKDYEAIKRCIPEAKPKQVKWIKELFDMARAQGYPEPVAKNILWQVDEMLPRLRIQGLAGIKRDLAIAQKQKVKPTAYEQNGQLELFHPEAFQGGENQTLREM